MPSYTKLGLVLGVLAFGACVVVYFLADPLPTTSVVVQPKGTNLNVLSAKANLTAELPLPATNLTLAPLPASEANATTEANATAEATPPEANATQLTSSVVVTNATASASQSALNATVSNATSAAPPTPAATPTPTSTSAPGEPATAAPANVTKTTPTPSNSSTPANTSSPVSAPSPEAHPAASLEAQPVAPPVPNRPNSGAPAKVWGCGALPQLPAAALAKCRMGASPLTRPGMTWRLFKGSECASSPPHVPQPGNICVLNDFRVLRNTPYVQYWRDIPAEEKQHYINGKPAAALPGKGGKVDVDAEFILSVPRGVVRGDIGTVFNPQFFLKNDKWYYNLPSPAAKIAPAVPKLLTLVQLWGSSMQHFSFDEVPRMEFVTPFLRANPDVKILMAGTKFPKAVAKAIWPEFPESRFVWAAGDHVYPADMLYFPHFFKTVVWPMGSAPFNGMPFISRALQSMILPPDVKEPLPFPSPERKHVILIGRRPGRTRSIANQASLERSIRAVLKPEYTLSVYLDPQSLDAVEHLWQAAVLLGPHGGALGNILFLAQGVPVVEFMTMNPRGTHVRACFVGLAHAVNASYWHVEPTVFDYGKGAMQVPETAVVAALRDMGVAKKSRRRR